LKSSGGREWCSKCIPGAANYRIELLMTIRTRLLTAGTALCALGIAFMARADEYPLSLQLEVLERDLGSADYHAVLKTMISTDLAAEWRRVATPDNYHLFAQQHGGLEKVQRDPALKAAFERRKEIATRFLDLLRATYDQKKLKPPFADEVVLIRVLESGAKSGASQPSGETRIGPVMPAPGAEANWPCFRGPTSQGIVLDTHVPEKWSDTDNVRWRVQLPGRGNSSPVVWNDRLFVTAESERRPDDAPLLAKDKAPDRLLLCYSTEGHLLWQQAAPRPEQHEILYWKNTLASSTPVTDGERVIVFFGNAGLVCWDFTGKQLWHVDLGTFPTTHGPGSAPVLYQDLVIQIQDQNKGRSLCAAFDKRTGSKVWERERPNSMGWSNPVVLKIGDRDQLIFNGSNDVVAYDPLTGDELWKQAGTSIESIPMIAAGEGLLFSSSGRNGPIFALRPRSNLEVLQPELVWRNEHGGPHVPSPGYHAGRLYFVNDTGIAMCLRAATGETLWQKRLRGRFSASPLIVGDKVYLISEEGVTYILKSSPKFELLAENPLSETMYATPAVLGGRIYFRSTTGLVCIGK
jgi:outer membrane protein assembly factor BamB